MTHKPQVGIMQGRLSNQIGDSIQSFPGVYWKEEFDQASNLGFNTIEWIFDSHKNPLFHSDAISEIISIKKKYGVEINSVCADYFMEHKLFNESENEISKMIGRSRALKPTKPSEFNGTVNKDFDEIFSWCVKFLKIWGSVCKNNLGW